MSWFSNAMDSARTWIVQPILDIYGGSQNTQNAMQVNQQYYRGNQRPMLATKPGKPDDNIVINLVKKAVNKSVSMLVGGEVRFDLGETAPDEHKNYIDKIWRSNKQAIFLKKLAKTGALNGTVYIKVLPEFYGTNAHRLVSLKPEQMEIETDPDDLEIVEAYVQTWNSKRRNDNGHEVNVTYRETTRRDFYERDETGAQIKDDGKLVPRETDAWEVVLEEKMRGGRWALVERTAWEYPFPPIIHGQNLPVDDSPYGEADADGMIGVQDRVNFVVGTVSKIVRYHGHPKTVGTGFSAAEVTSAVQEGEKISGAKTVEMSGDQMLTIGKENAKVFNLEMQSELVPVSQFLQFLVQTFFDLTDTVNLSNIKDKLGQLTNFGLQVLYQDALEKLQTKRDLYGDLLVELNRRLLALMGESMKYENIDAGVVVWPADVMPQNSLEEAEELQLDMGMKLVSVETARGLRGYDHEQEEERLANQVDDGELGARLIAAFNQGAQV